MEIINGVQIQRVTDTSRNELARESGGNLERLSDSLQDYRVSNIDSSTPAYYGFTDKAGNWYIMKNNSGAYTYVKGVSGYTTAWTARASQTYDYFYNIF